MEKIPFMRPNVVKKEAYLPYLDRIDESRIYSNFGSMNDLFEKRIVKEIFDGSGSVCTVNNATTGLILAISQLKRKNAKYAIMPSFTFSATPLAAQWCGLEPYFIDIDPSDWTLNLSELERTVKKLGDQVAVVMPYATFGTFMDVSYYNYLHNSGIPVVIDAAASFGVTNDEGEQFGKDFLGFVIYSFHATKAFGIGEGGIVYSNDSTSIKQIRQASNFGYMGNRTAETLGMNGKLSEIMSAIGLATLDVFQEKITLRDMNYKKYVHEVKKHELLSKGWQLHNVTGRVPHQIMSILCPVNKERSKVLEYLDNHGIECRTYFDPPCHAQPQFSSCSRESLTVSEDISSRIISLPFWEELSSKQIEYIGNVLADYC